MGRRTMMIEANGGVALDFAVFGMKRPTYVCVYVLWERMDVRWELYLCKTTIYIYIYRGFVGSGIGYCYLLVEARVDWETGLAEREMRRSNETLLDPSMD
jgi:hypothetical protein